MRVFAPLARSLVFLFPIVGCADEAGVVPGPRGSAFPIDSLPNLTLREDVRIGNEQDPLVGFTRIGGMDVAADGRVVVIEQSQDEIRVYSPSGQLLRTLGGTGSGPGEFQYPYEVGVDGDTIWVWDPGRRVTLLSLEGDVLLTVPGGGASVTVGAESFRVVPRRPMRNGRFEGEMWNPGPGLEPVGSLYVPRLIFDSSGTVVDTIGVFFRPARPPYQVVVDNLGIVIPEPRYAWPIRVGVGGDSLKITRPVANDGNEGYFEVTRGSQRGDTIYSTVFRYRPEPLDEDALIAQELSRYSSWSGDLDAAYDAVAEVFNPPAYHPPVKDYRVGDDGSMWLQGPDFAEDSLTWLVLDSDGGPRGLVEVPRSQRVMWVSEEAVWLQYDDDLNIPWLVRMVVTTPDLVG